MKKRYGMEKKEQTKFRRKVTNMNEKKTSIKYPEQ